ncbi:MAG: hypothetical protein IJ590_04365 [Rickettsiales bacterium]|nr:hypothetical protein [Rickettsiales bacterium]
MPSCIARNQHFLLYICFSYPAHETTYANAPMKQLNIKHDKTNMAKVAFLAFIRTKH